MPTHPLQLASYICMFETTRWTFWTTRPCSLCIYNMFLHVALHSTVCWIKQWVWVHLNWVLSELSVNPTNMMHFQPWGPISVSADPSGLLVSSWPLQTLDVQFETTGDWDLCLEYPARPLSSTKAELVRPITFFKASIKTLLSLTG